MTKVAFLTSALIIGASSALAGGNCIVTPFKIKCIETTAENAWSDVTKGPGQNNDAFKVIKNVTKDVTQGPGKSNDITGKDGWLRKRLGF